MRCLCRKDRLASSERRQFFSKGHIRNCRVCKSPGCKKLKVVNRSGAKGFSRHVQARQLRRQGQTGWVVFKSGGELSVKGVGWMGVGGLQRIDGMKLSLGHSHPLNVIS
jgi:hypothetical protein